MNGNSHNIEITADDGILDSYGYGALELSGGVYKSQPGVDSTKLDLKFVNVRETTEVNRISFKTRNGKTAYLTVLRDGGKVEQRVSFSFLITLYTGNPVILSNNVDQDEILHNAAFYQGLHCLPRLKQLSGTEIHHNFRKCYLSSLEVHNGQSHTYCINMYVKSIRIQR